MDLAVDSAFSESDSESSVVTPGFVPRVDCDPVVFAPSDQFDGMSSQGFSFSVSVDSRLVVHKIFVDSESSSHSSVLVNLLLNVFDSSNTIGRRSFLLIFSVNIIVFTGL